MIGYSRIIVFIDYLRGFGNILDEETCIIIKKAVAFIGGSCFALGSHLGK